MHAIETGLARPSYAVVCCIAAGIAHSPRACAARSRHGVSQYAVACGYTCCTTQAERACITGCGGPGLAALLCRQAIRSHKCGQHMLRQFHAAVPLHCRALCPVLPAHRPQGWLPCCESRCACVRAANVHLWQGWQACGASTCQIAGLTVRAHCRCGCLLSRECSHCVLTYTKSAARAHRLPRWRKMYTD